MFQPNLSDLVRLRGPAVECFHGVQLRKLTHRQDIYKPYDLSGKLGSGGLLFSLVVVELLCHYCGQCRHSSLHPSLLLVSATLLCIYFIF